MEDLAAFGTHTHTGYFRGKQKNHTLYQGVPLLYCYKCRYGAPINGLIHGQLCIITNPYKWGCKFQPKLYLVQTHVASLQVFWRILTFCFFVGSNLEVLQRVLQSDVHMEWSQFEGPRGIGRLALCLGRSTLRYLGGSCGWWFFRNTSHGAGRFTCMDGWVLMVQYLVNVDEYTIRGCYG